MRAATSLSLAAFLASAGLAMAVSHQPSNKPRREPGTPTRPDTRNETRGTTRTEPGRTEPARRDPAPASAPGAQPTGDILRVYSAGLAQFFSNPKDAGVRDALALVQPRLVELAQMQGTMPDPEKAIGTMWTIASSPMSLRIAATEPGENGEPPFAVHLTSRPEDARALERTIVALMRDNGLEMRSTDSGREIDTPMGPARFGLDDNNTTLNLALGEPLPEMDFQIDLPGGYVPIFALHANLQHAQPFLEMALSQAPDQGQAREMMERAGVLGDDALILDMVVGQGEHDCYMAGSLEGARARSEALGMPEGVVLDAAFLSMIPADTTQLMAGVFDLGSMDQVLDMPEMQDGLNQINDQLGINIRQDIIDAIGNRAAVYQSDRTGGGGILSSVLILELDNPADFARAHKRLVNQANDFIAEQLAQNPAPGPFQPSVEIMTRRMEGVEFFTLTWPGLPIPAEISWTIQGDYLMAALSPRSLLEAMAQGQGDGGSFASSPVLAGLAGADVNRANLLSVSYTDVPRFAHQGYSLVSLLCSGLANALRTADGEDPGIPLPPYNEFMADIRPTIMISQWQGEDLVWTGKSDSSMLVNVAGSSGSILGPVAIASALGAVLPAMEKARDSAKQIAASSQLRGLTMGMVMYSSENRDDLPGSFDEIMEYISPEMLISPLGPAMDGGADYALRTDMDDNRMSQIQDPSRTLAAIDRASLVNGQEMVIVAFFDGHVESIYSWQLTDLLAQEENRGAYEAFNLPDWMNPGF